MEEKLNKAIEILAARIIPTVQPHDAMQLAQAALNLAHTKSIAAAVEKEKGTKTKGAGS